MILMREHQLSFMLCIMYQPLLKPSVTTYKPFIKGFLLENILIEDVTMCGDKQLFQLWSGIKFHHEPSGCWLVIRQLVYLNISHSNHANVSDRSHKLHFSLVANQHDTGCSLWLVKVNDSSQSKRKTVYTWVAPQHPFLSVHLWKSVLIVLLVLSQKQLLSFLACQLNKGSFLWAVICFLFLRFPVENLCSFFFGPKGQYTNTDRGRDIKYIEIDGGQRLTHPIMRTWRNREIKQK